MKNLKTIYSISASTILISALSLGQHVYAVESTFANNLKSFFGLSAPTIPTDVTSEAKGGNDVKQKIPDNVKITNTHGATTIVVESQPGYRTYVTTSCVHNECKNDASTTKITDSDIKQMNETLRKQQEAMQRFWEAQNKIFAEQQKLFKSLWGF